ncbi:DUF3443 domain-containing protein [Variovorax sp. J22R133]|uniref:DUF3443 domain-containing protein n=1 Tax=Variovorax brevis TaxID=3053503 RepID=UPI002576524B|nr:DUF3443 domain-containing protein [Variovorax sp. J22R133]MDM0113668.1 DUF3443 domain-containing protein [Variovorax sp. J22R133]
MKTFASALRLAAILCALALASCGGGGGGNSSGGGTPSGPPSASLGPAQGVNEALITVGNGPDGPNTKINVPFVSVQVCAPGGGACQTIDHVILDTGSTGLRIVASALNNRKALKQSLDATNRPFAECAQFVNGFAWGSVKVADVRMAGEVASSVPIQVIGDPDFPNIPTSCSNVGGPMNTVDSFGGNGLLGVDAFRQDCGRDCANTTIPGAAIPGTYYACASGASCVSTPIPLAQQVTHPVSLFGSDNNGVMIQLPDISTGGDVNVTGLLVFGIGTRNNNAPGSAKAFGLDGTGGFTTVINGQRYPGSFIDSGSNYFFFNTSQIPTCNVGGTGFYCPASPQSLSAVVQGANGANATVDFSIVNASTALSKNRAASAFKNLGAPLQGYPGFDWGLPFFYGRRVFVALDGASTPVGTGPYVGF